MFVSKHELYDWLIISIVAISQSYLKPINSVLTFAIMLIKFSQALASKITFSAYFITGRSFQMSASLPLKRWLISASTLVYRCT